jgi:hypothetical protein
MKLFFVLMSAGIIALTACSKQNETSTTPVNETIDTTMGGTGSPVPILTHEGMFIKGPYGTVTGTAKIFSQSGTYTLAFENVAISNGPDLHVYLSKEVQPIHFIDLGKLKSTSGNQLYDVPGMPNLMEYKYALVHCQQYDHLFGSAELKK